MSPEGGDALTQGAQREQPWLPHAWKCPRPGWMVLGATQTILSFCEELTKTQNQWQSIRENAAFGIWYLEKNVSRGADSIPSLGSLLPCFPQRC